MASPSWARPAGSRCIATAPSTISRSKIDQECVTRSENGTPLQHGGPEVTGLISYMTWITQQATAEGVTPIRGVDAKIPTRQGDATRGESIYKEQCSGCHGADGAGVVGVFRRSGVRDRTTMAPALLPGKMAPSFCTICRRTIRESSRRKKPGTSRRSSLASRTRSTTPPTTFTSTSWRPNSAHGSCEKQDAVIPKRSEGSAFCSVE